MVGTTHYIGSMTRHRTHRDRSCGVPTVARRTARLPTMISGVIVSALTVALAGCGGPSPKGDASPVGSGGRNGPVQLSADASLGPYSDGPSPVPARRTGPQGSYGQFVTDCALSHTAPDDPIVHPVSSGDDPDHAGHVPASDTASTDHGTSGRSHLHQFFGNTSTDSSSTLESLLGADTTCQKKLDRAAYWVPALYDGDEVVTPTKSTAYYRVAPGVDATRIEAFPPGLKIIAGDADAKRPQSADLVGWGCGTSTIQSTTPPVCPVSAPLRAVITFPDCWDGVNIDSPDHRSHMTNSTAGLCPESHPVHVPQLTFAITYPISGDGHDLSLASGPIETLHSDFINSWHQDSLEEEVGNCLRRDITCSLSSNRGEEFLFEGY